MDTAGGSGYQPCSLGAFNNRPIAIFAKFSIFLNDIRNSKINFHPFLDGLILQ